MKNRLRDKIDKGEPVLGAWLAFPDTHSAELMSRLGFDWATIDMQHGLVDYQRATEMLQAMTASDTTPIVRVPWNEPGIIGKMLDAGAHGIIIPMVNSRAEAEAAAAACRYPPRGKRSFGPFRAGLLYGGNYLEEANEQIYCIPMIETQQALD
ncbi:MAG: aldolase/citrate lyase family protein, partial [Acidobacteria bacterium]|nr:aldolase/citrate lyase family protein [Acidobacteriota bacterium]